MTDITSSPLPYHRLRVYHRAVALLEAVKAAKLGHARLREQAINAAMSACLNISEAAGRVSPADKARVFGIARGETVEAIAAVEIAVHAGYAHERGLSAVMSHGREVYAMLTALARRR